VPEGAEGRPLHRVLAGFQRAIEGIAIVFGTIGVIGFSVIVIYVVFARYLLGATPYWAEELPRLLLVWVAFMGTVSAFVRNSHFQAGLLPLVLGEGRSLKIAGLVAGLLSIVFLLVLAKTGYDLTLRTWSHRTTALKWPAGLSYLALPVCCSLAAAAVAAGLVIGRRERSGEMSE
jgi:TRAP-type transport system small permease protein